MRRIAALLIVSACLASCAPYSFHHGELPLLEQYMTGSFSSQAQAEADPENYLHIMLHMQPIWTGRTDGAWLYVEQAAASAPERPYRQRVYHLRRSGESEYRSDVYTLPGDPLRFAGAWEDPGLLDDLRPCDLELREGCAVVMTYHWWHWSGVDESGAHTGGWDTAFRGATEGDGCASSLAGAAYATSEVEIDSNSLSSWDRGFDAEGEQVWGATEGPYIFRRTSD